MEHMWEQLLERERERGSDCIEANTEHGWLKNKIKCESCTGIEQSGTDFTLPPQPEASIC